MSKQLIKRIATPQTFYSRNSKLRSFATETNEPPVSKTKQFMKKYGYVGIGTYLALGTVDLAATMALIYWNGAENVKEIEHYVINKAKGVLGMEQTAMEKHDVNEKPSFGSMFVIAYGIHKTLLLPFRLSLTAAITPTISKRLAKLGWVQKRLSKHKK